MTKMLDAKLAAMMLLMACVLFPACTPDDRCGNDFYFEDGVCIPVAVEDTETDSVDVCGGDTDSDTRVGIGEVCDSNPGSCTGDAEYCIIQPGAAEGYCSYLDCVGNPCDDCPANYTCCVEFQFTGDNMCMKSEDFESMSAFCVGNQ